MNAALHVDVERLRDELVCLVETCPVDRCNPVDCPLFGLRNLAIKERLRWFGALREEDLRYLAGYHYVCMKVKLASQPDAGRPGAS